MRFKHLSVVLLAGVLLFSAGCGKKAGGGENPLYSDASTPSSEIDAKFLLEWWDALFAFVGSERLSPPDASRMFAYISVGLYEAQICGTSNYLTLENQLSDFENVPRPEKGQVYDWQTCVTETM